MTFDIDPESKARQRSLVLEALRAGPVTTAYSRDVLGVWHVAGRVLELRKAGHCIATKMVSLYDSEGRPHRSASYTLQGEL